MMKGNIEIHKELRTEFANKDSMIDIHSKRINVLIIEDHPITHKQIAKTFFELNKLQEEYFFVLDLAFNCEDAYHKLASSKERTYDLVILDIKLPPYYKEKLYSGEDIGEWIRENIIPPPKIVIVTYINENQRIENLIKSIKPNGFLVKEDISCKILLEAIKNSFEGDPYYTQSVVNLATKLLSTNVIVDTLDRRLLTELACGAKMSELEELLPLSKSAIEKKKNLLFYKLDIKSNSTRDLVLKAKKLGYL